MDFSTFNKNLRIGVLMGGLGIEREVSFSSGRTICDHLDTTIYSVIPIFQSISGELYILPWHFLHRGKTSDFESRLEREAKKIEWDDLKSLIDFAYIAMHGRYAEDGTIQGFLEVLSIPYLGAKVFGSAAGMDKIFQKKFLKMNGVFTACGIEIYPHEFEKTEIYLDKILNRLKEENINFPIVIKPKAEGSSFGLSIVENKDNILEQISFAMYCAGDFAQPVLIEEKLSGMEFTSVHISRLKGNSVFSDNEIFNNYCRNEDELLDPDWISLPLTEIIVEEGRKFYDYEQKYMPGLASKLTPARCSKSDTKKIQEICLTTLKVLNFSTISRIDGFLTLDGRVVIIDANSLAGMTPSSFIFHQAAAVGLNHSQFINYLITSEIENTNKLSLLRNFEFQKNKSDFMKKIKVAVLLGGDSHEREISLDSGRNVCYKLSPQKYEAIPIFVDEQMNLFLLTSALLIKNSTRDIKKYLKNEMQIKWSELPKIADFVFIGLHGGRGENGSVQGTLEMLNIPYNGSGVLASSLCMNKFKTNEFLKNQGFDIPKSILLTKQEWEVAFKEDLCDKLLSQFELPLIIKPHDDGCSVLVKKIKTKDQLLPAIAEFFSTEKTTIMIEEFIVGMELTCGVIGNKDVIALPPSMPAVGNDVLSIEEKFLPGAGENQTPAPLPIKVLDFVRRVIKNVYVTIGCSGYARIDCFYQNENQSPTKKERVIILEINSLPGITPATCIFHQAAEIGIQPMDFIDKIIQLGFENHSIIRNNRIEQSKEVNQ